MCCDVGCEMTTCNSLMGLFHDVQGFILSRILPENVVLASLVQLACYELVVSTLLKDMSSFLGSHVLDVC